MNTEENIRFEISDGLATITLNRPPVNVMNNAMMAELNAVLDKQVLGANLAALVIRASGKVHEMTRQFHGIFRRLASTDALTIALVDGAALGGGCELATFCDIVLASERSKFGQPEVQVGVLPPVAACVFPLQVGIRKAIELNAVGMTIGAREAQAIGLVNQVYPVEEFERRVEEYLGQIRKLSRPVVRMAKKATSMATREQILSELDRIEKLYLDELMKLSDAHEGLTAFLEKRAPRWKHA
jgi:enoyl-CoA hydratase/carnithine racemase